MIQELLEVLWHVQTKLAGESKTNRKRKTNITVAILKIPAPTGSKA